MGSSAVMQIMQTDEHFLQEMKEMGYPLYFLRLLGISKLLGIVALLVPGFPRIREWAYAGFTITLVAAIYSHIAIGEFEITHFIILGILFTSYFLGNTFQKMFQTYKN